MSVHEMSLGGLVFDGDGVAAGTGYTYSVAADGIEFGSAESAYSVVQALWSSGSLVELEHDDNAETTFRLMIEADSPMVSGSALKKLAEGAAEFDLALPDGDGTVVPFVWRPSESGAPAAVRRVVAGRMDFVYDDLTETDRPYPYRVYDVTLTHEPWVRSEHETVVPAVPYGSGGPVVIDTCDSAVGWSADNPVTASGGAIHTVGTHTEGGSTELTFWNIQRAGTITLANTPNITLEVRGASAVYLTNSGVDGGAPYKTEALGDGWYRYTYATAGASLDGLSLHANALAFTSQPLSIREVSRSGTHAARQATRAFGVGGTKPTGGRVHIAQRSGSGALGSVIFASSPGKGDGYEPQMSRWRTASGTESTAGAELTPSGKWWQNTLTVQVPTATIEPGPYVIAAWVRSSTAGTGTLGCEVSTVIAGQPNTLPTTVTSPTLSFTVGAMRLVILGTHELPTIRTRTGHAQIKLTYAGSGSHSIQIGEVWAFKAGRHCGLSYFQAIGRPHLWLDSATRTQQAGATASATANPNDGYYPFGDHYLDDHIFTPGTVDTFVFTLGGENPVVDLSYYKTWNDHPADDGSVA